MTSPVQLLIFQRMTSKSTLPMKATAFGENNFCELVIDPFRGYHFVVTRTNQEREVT